MDKDTPRAILKIIWFHFKNFLSLHFSKERKDLRGDLSEKIRQAQDFQSRVGR